MPRGGPRFASRKLSPNSRRPLRAIDGRTLEARRERQIVDELVDHVGGSPSAPQKIIIARAARLLVMIELMERRMVEAGEVGDLSGRQILAWVNSLRLLLTALGIERPQRPPATLKSYLGGRAA